MTEPAVVEHEHTHRHPLLLELAPPLLVVLLMVQLRACLSPALNPDTYFHLRIGEEFLSGRWSLWHPGHLSSYATRDWLPTQWSSEMVMAQFEDWFGLGGVRWLWGASFVGFIVAAYLTCRRQGSAMVAAGLTVTVMVIARSGLSARPQMVSYILTLVFVGAWLRTCADGRNRWWLVPLTWVWATAHGMWPVGLSIGFVAAVSAVLSASPADRRRTSRLLLNPVACALAAALTPIGPGLYGAVLNVTGISDLYSEWAPPNFKTLSPALLLVMILAVLVIELRRVGAVPWDRALLVLLALGWAVYSSRTVPVAACIAAPLLARAATERLPAMTNPRNDRRIVLGGALTALAVLAALLTAFPVRGAADPAWVSARFDSLPAGTSVLSTTYTGGYLSWRYPRLDILNDGYGDQYARHELVALKDLFTLEPGWMNRLRALNVDWVLVPPDSPLAAALAQEPGWRVVNRSKQIELLHSAGG